MEPGRLTREVSALLSDEAGRARMGESISSFAYADANKLIYEELMRLVAQKGMNAGEKDLPEIPAPDVMPEKK